LVVPYLAVNIFTPGVVLWQIDPTRVYVIQLAGGRTDSIWIANEGGAVVGIEDITESTSRDVFV